MTYSVGILGATGTVGQRFIALLSNHPLFVIKVLGASERSVGKSYGQVVNWQLNSEIPVEIAEMTVQTCDPKYFTGCSVIFSGLDASVAGDIEMLFVQNEFSVFSNAKNHRMNPLVPLIVPSVNSNHFDMIKHQRSSWNLTKGMLVTNANCSTTGLVITLKALQNAFGSVDKVCVTTMQAISGAGYPGVPSLDILGNVIPHISGEEQKMEKEICKILCDLNDSKTEFNMIQDVKLSASCNRVPVIEGHTESVFVSFKTPPSSLEDVFEAFRCFTSLSSFSAPNPLIVVRHESNRPQPKLDLGNGFSVVVGNIRSCPIFDVKFTLLLHNTILGAAGSAIWNAEIAHSKGLLY
jgi:aspartate-semialdehyde dehydrogenase